MNSQNSKKRSIFLSLLMVAFVGAFIISFVGAVKVSTETPELTVQNAYAASSASVPAGAPLSFADLADELKPAVVNISTTKTVVTGGMGNFRHPFGSPFERYFGDDFFERFFGNMPERRFKQSSLGSGFIISKDGYIFTNFHVVEKADEIVVKLTNGDEYKATIQGTDKNTDIALLKIEPKEDLPVAKLGDSEALRVGDWVIAIGNPFGLSQTVTAGIVSAKGRVIGAGPYDDFIQTDASINPGNSGGPLFNLGGEVVGINTAIVAQGQGIGFAIPIGMAKEILPQLKTKGKVVRGWLGVSVQDITDEIAENLSLKTKMGALISDVFPDDPADRAGLKTGDVIVDVDGNKIKNTHELLVVIAGLTVGRTVEITVLRNGTERTVAVEISERREGIVRTELEEEKEYFGMTVQEVTPEIAQHLELPVDSGVIVTQVESGGPAEGAGIQERDIILQVNRARITSLKEYATVMEKAKSKDSVLVLIQRGDSKFFVVINK